MYTNSGVGILLENISIGVEIVFKSCEGNFSGCTYLNFKSVSTECVVVSGFSSVEYHFFNDYLAKCSSTKLFHLMCMH